MGPSTATSPAKFIHPSHDNPARANDIALLRLEEPATMGKTISPPCLPEQVGLESGLEHFTQGDFGDESSFPAGAPCLLSGWGVQVSIGFCTKTEFIRLPSTLFPPGCG